MPESETESPDKFVKLIGDLINTYKRLETEREITQAAELKKAEKEIFSDG